MPPSARPADSVRQLRMALGRRGMSVEDYDIVHVPQIDGPLGPAFGNSPHTSDGFPMRGPRGRPVIEISDLGLRDMDEAVSTVFHETMHHHQQAARRGMQDAHNGRAYITTPGDEDQGERVCPACEETAVRTYVYRSRLRARPTLISYMWCAVCRRSKGWTGPDLGTFDFTDPLGELTGEERVELAKGGGLFRRLDELWEAGRLPQRFILS
ncbi:hypothetical protein AB0B50_22340 [Streptomyces sp. NPDC041068]|uniref:hypothetical protein n=1 Tax=Streptomyces sp. NPDC041068 TaxID=3155130 RepID=UPI0033DDC485